MITALPKRDTAIISSVLDTDLYKFTMGQFVWQNAPDTEVTYTLTNRHSDRVHVAELVDINELKEELRHVETLSLSPSELEYLSSLGIFNKHYISFLERNKLPEVDVVRRGDQYDISVSGKWSTTIFWETIILSIVNELIGRAYSSESRTMRDTLGKWKLSGKIASLRENPDVSFVEFGTRRRFSAQWQEYVVRELALHLPNQLAGTSNVHLARILGLVPVGTFAHETHMAYAAIASDKGDRAVRESHGEFLDKWWDLYGERLSIALTDTWGARFFFSDFGAERARDWKGLRHDSGDPFKWGERALSFYRSVGVDSREKTLLWSDGLNVDTVLALHEAFSSHTNVSFGWGTNLTNDVGFPSTSIVMKLTEVSGQPTVKLSDNLAKAMGPREEVLRYSKIFGHEDSEWSDCKY